MATARDFITLAMKEAGVLGLGQSLNDEDINDGFTLLNRMLAQWQKRRWLVPSLYEVAAQGNGQIYNYVGPGQYYNAARPDKIQAAYFKQLSGGGGSNQVSYPLIPIWSYEDYSRIALKNLQSWPVYFFYDNGFPNGKVYIWPIPTIAYEIHLVLKSPIGFTTAIDSGVFKTSGGGYTTGAYDDVPLLNFSGFGSGATATINIDAFGFVSNFVIKNPGDGYNIGDLLTFDVSSAGGTGSGFTWAVNDVTDSLDTEFNMPAEYEEAIHYNLCVRLTSMYQMPPNPVQGALAAVALNTLKRSNAQIPKLRMPSSLQFGNNGGFYIFNADQ